MTDRPILRTRPHQPPPPVCLADTPFQRLCFVAATIVLVLCLLIIAPNAVAWP